MIGLFVLLLLFVVLNFSDFIITTLAISQHGVEIEANPLLLYAMTSVQSFWPLFVAKVAATAIAIFAFYHALFERRARVILTVALLAVNLLLVYAIVLGLAIIVGS